MTKMEARIRSQEQSAYRQVRTTTYFDIKAARRKRIKEAFGMVVTAISISAIVMFLLLATAIA